MWDVPIEVFIIINYSKSDWEFEDVTNYTSVTIADVNPLNK